VFDNDFPALLENCPQTSDDSNDPLFRAIPAKGKCKVICFHPNSSISLPLMSNAEILKVIDTWIRESMDLGRKYNWVQLFENKGAIMGCSNPHPHCQGMSFTDNTKSIFLSIFNPYQVWSSDFLPNEARIKDRMQRLYKDKHNRPLLMDYVTKELDKKIRIVVQNQNWVVLVPYWAIWPFETMILPKRHVLRLEDLNEAEKNDLADVMKRLLIKYDNMFEISFPYSMGWHGIQLKIKLLN